MTDLLSLVYNSALGLSCYFAKPFKSRAAMIEAVGLRHLLMSELLLLAVRTWGPLAVLVVSHRLDRGSARLQGTNGTSGIVRVRVNTTGHSPTAITRPVADRLGLQRRPLPGPGIASVWGGGGAVPVEVLSTPLTVQLLSSPDTVAMSCSMGVVLVVPSFADAGDELFEVQLGLLDFCAGFDTTMEPQGIRRYTDKASGHSFVVPLVAPKQSRSIGTSSFNVVGESLDEVTDLLRVRRASLARQRAAAAGRNGANSDLWLNAAEAVAPARRQRAAASEPPVQGQLQRSIQRPAVPDHQQQLPQPGPALRFLLDGRQVIFCTTEEDYRYHHLRPPPAGLFNSVPEHAARLQGANGTSGIVRVRVNPTGQAPSSITRPVADRLGLERRPLRGPGITWFGVTGGAVPVEVLTAPVTLQLLSSPDNVVLSCSMGVVLVVPSFANPGDELFEVQLGSLGFCENVDTTMGPQGVRRYTDKASGHSWVVPLVAPKQTHYMLGTSSFNVVGESLDEVMDLRRTYLASLGQRRGPAAARVEVSRSFVPDGAGPAAPSGHQSASRAGLVAAEPPVQGQLQRSIQRPAVPDHQQQLPQPGPALRFLLDRRQVIFCTTEEDYRYHHLRPPPAGLFNSVPEHAARLQGANGTSGIVRVRVNPTGLQRRPLQGPGALFMCETGEPLPLGVLLEPLTVKLLSGRGTVALEVTLPAVVVVPTRAEAGDDLFELQLGSLDFCKEFDVVLAPPWVCQFTHRASGHQCSVPFVHPQQSRSVGGSSSFNVLEESYDEEMFFSGLAIAISTPSPRAAAAAVSSSGSRVEIDDELAQHQHQRAQRNQQTGWRGRGRDQQQAASNDFVSAADWYYCVGHPVDSGAEEDAGAAATSSTGVYAGLDPLPAGLVACRWSWVAATSLPRADATCSICFEDFADRLVNGGVRLVTQLRCRHTFCVLCLRQYITNDSFQGRPLQCPQCREEVQPS
eukprot:gene12151-12289_t